MVSKDDDDIELKNVEQPQQAVQSLPLLPEARLGLERIMSKEGTVTFVPTNVPKQHWKFMRDIFTTLVETKWRWTLFTFCLVYFGSWLLFALLWYLILYSHGDLEHFGEEGWNPCITGIQHFTSAFLFSVETQHTTGYGFYELTAECPASIILFCVQSIVGVILEGLMVGMVFVKMSRAKKRGQTFMFSKNAVISKKRGVLSFMFRVADMRKSHLLDAHIFAQVIWKKTTREGELVIDRYENLEVGGDGERKNKLLLLWPTTVIHKIDKKSPLRNLKPELLLQKTKRTFEIVVVLEGIVESTGLNVQVRSSYLPSEILWGRQFTNLTSSWTKSGFTGIDYALFNDTVPTDSTAYVSLVNENHGDSGC